MKLWKRFKEAVRRSLRRMADSNRKAFAGGKPGCCDTGADSVKKAKRL